MKDFLKNKNVIIVSIIIFLCILYFVVNIIVGSYDDNITTTEENIANENTNNEYTEEEVNVTTEVEENIEENEKVTNAETEKIYVYVTGEVNLPGVVILDKGSRVVDAINAAGGTTNNANTTKVNLVYVLEDGMKINIPNNEDLKDNTQFEYITMDSGDGANDSSEGNASSNNEDSNTNSKKSNSKVNINTATQTELETLPGIGPSTALKIINYRNENGKFTSIEDIKNVNGIGDSKFENMKNYITI